jgi:phospholipid:diacylglycerol acyltransferase
MKQMEKKSEAAKDSSSIQRPPSEIQTHASDTIDSHLDDDSEEASPCQDHVKPSCSTRVGRLITFTFLLWVSEIVLGVCLKRCGIKNIRLDEFVAQTVLPPLEKMGWNRINESISMAYFTQERLRPGFQLAQQGAKAHYPVVMVPGFVTSALELWGAEECARNHFRERLWGSAFGAARTFLVERDCWRQHMALDPFTGIDPPNIRVRAAQGFEAADYFMANYWVWGKIIENLADVGYDGSNMAMESYDWRLSFPMLEKRDGYLTKLRHKIEAMHETNGAKVVLTTHSMGAQLVHYFFAWVTTEERLGGGGGGKDWVDKHVHAYVNIAGSHLGVPKAATALLSGEMRDTILMGALASMVESFFGRVLRKELWLTWGSLWHMLPKGGDALWGIGADMCNDTDVIDVLACRPSGYHYPSLSEHPELTPLLVMTNDSSSTLPDLQPDETCSVHNISTGLESTVEEFGARRTQSTLETLAFLKRWGGGAGPKVASAKLLKLHFKGKPSKEEWDDPTRTPLPYAPNLKIYCFYGMGLDTERAYFYKREAQEMINTCDESNTTQQSSYSANPDLPFIIDTSVEDPTNRIRHGVRMSDGDGSVPLISLGYVCVDAWPRKDSGMNPSGAKVVTREYPNRQEFSVDDPMRGGPSSSDHVDILGNFRMNEDLVRVVTNFETGKLKTDLVSDIESIARRINAHPQGGVFRRRK